LRLYSDPGGSVFRQISIETSRFKKNEYYFFSCGTLFLKFEIMGGGSNRDSASCLYTGSVEGNSESLGINFRPSFKTKKGNVKLFVKMKMRKDERF
jgi:hypothetical protein